MNWIEIEDWKSWKISGNVFFLAISLCFSKSILRLNLLSLSTRRDSPYLVDDLYALLRRLNLGIDVHDVEKKNGQERVGRVGIFALILVAIDFFGQRRKYG